MRNDAAGACSVTDATVAIRVPDPDGTQGVRIVIATDADFPGGMPPTTLPGRAPYDVAFDPDVFRGPIRVEVDGTYHFPGGDTESSQSLQSNIVVSKPSATLTVVPNPTSGPAPLDVTYTYEVSNTSAQDPAGEMANPTPMLRAPEHDHAVVEDDTCAPLVFTGGDTNVSVPPQLELGETWTFECRRLFGEVGTFVNTARIIGYSPRDGRNWPVTTAQAAVTALGPDLTVTKTHEGDFKPGDSGRTYTLVVTNSGNEPTSAPVELKDTLPNGLKATAISGQGWSCHLPTLTCTRADTLGAGHSYPPVTLTVDVAPNAPEEVTNTATVSGGGDLTTSNNTASDVTKIDYPPETTITKKPKKKSAKRRATFKFVSSEPDSTFECKLDKKPFKPCTSPQRYKRLKPKRHRFQVRAIDAAGNVDPTPAKAKFRIKKRR